MIQLPSTTKRRATLVCTTWLFVAAVAEADDDSAARSSLPAYGTMLAIGPTLGLQSANGLSLHVGPRYGFILSGGYQLVFIGYTEQDPTEPKFELFFPYQLDADAKFELVVTKERGTAVGARPGYRYNSLLGHGIHIGGYAGIALNEQFTLDVGYGFIIFPDGNQRLREHENLSGAEFQSFVPTIQGGLSLGLLYTP